MVTNHKPSGRASSLAGGLAAGFSVAIVATVLLCALSAKMVDLQWIDEKDIGYCAMVILMAAPFLGTRTAQKRIQRQQLMVCVLSGSLYFIGLMAITALFFGGKYEAVAVTMLMVAAGTVLSVLTGNRKNRAGKGKKKRRHNC